MRFGVLAVLAAILAAPEWASAAEPPSQQAAAPKEEPRPVALTRVATKLAPGQTWVTLQRGFFCAPAGVMTWSGGQKNSSVGEFLDPFSTEMTKAGFKTVGGSTNLFESQAETSNEAEYSVGALITDMKIRACAPSTSGAAQIKGEAEMSIEWQIYSRLRRDVVAKIQTSGKTEIKTAATGGPALLISGAFQDNARQLAASPEFRRALTGPALASGATLAPAPQSPISLRIPPTAKRPLSEAAADVVVIFAGEGSGSGFLVSTDGYVLTDSHVVGSAKFVKVRWPDGTENLGDVVCVAKDRDVALIKTDPRGRSPLRLRRDPPRVGETVFAVGAPLGKRYEGTVTRGVVSANRVFEGLSYIQSDAAVSPGASGGPLLDEQGQVVALTAAGVRLAGLVPTGINLFIPAADAARFLSLTFQ